MRHLLSETAGLPATPESFPQLDWKDKTPQTDDGALERYVRILSDETILFEPGQGHVFSNMQYDIAGEVIAKVSGELFEENMHRHILEPLGMTMSTFYPQAVNPEQRATPHVAEFNGARVSELATWSRERVPSVGLFSNVDDLNRWMMANLNRGELDGVRFLQDASFDEIWAPTVHLGWGPDENDMGLGWWLGERRGYPVRMYQGTDLGVQASCYLVPELRAGAVALGNQFTGAGRTAFYATVLASMAVDLVAP
jgi:CubicO group peptidase (beta-lactamase class C family)